MLSTKNVRRLIFSGFILALVAFGCGENDPDSENRNSVGCNGFPPIGESWTYIRTASTLPIFPVGATNTIVAEKVEGAVQGQEVYRLQIDETTGFYVGCDPDQGGEYVVATVEGESINAPWPVGVARLPVNLFPPDAPVGASKIVEREGVRVELLIMAYEDIRVKYGAFKGTQKVKATIRFDDEVIVNHWWIDRKIGVVKREGEDSTEELLEYRPPQ